MDGSSSVGQQNFIQLLSLVKGTYHAFPVSEEEIRIALVVVSDAGKVVFNFDKDTEMAEIDKMSILLPYPAVIVTLATPYLY